MHTPVLRSIVMLIGSSLASYGATVSYPPGGGAGNIANDRVATSFEIEFPTDFVAMTAWLTQEPIPQFEGTLSWAIYNNSPGDNPDVIVSEGASQPLILATGRCPMFCEYRADLSFPAPLHLSPGTYWLELHSGATLTSNSGGFLGWEFSSRANALGYRFSEDLSQIPLTPGAAAFAFELTDVPEPSTFLFVFLGAAALIVLKVSRRCFVAGPAYPVLEADRGRLSPESQARRAHHWGRISNH